MNLEPIKTRLAAATPGPWGIHRDVPSQVVTVEETPEGDQLLVVEGFDGYEAADLELVANAPTDIAELVAEVERMTDLDTEMRALHVGPTDKYLPYCTHCNFRWPCPTIQLLDKHKEEK